MRSLWPGTREGRSFVTARGAGMTAARRAVVARYHSIHGAHPIYVLRWLRNVMLALILLAAIADAWVGIQANNDFSAAQRAGQAAAYARHAGRVVTDAQSKLQGAFGAGEYSLTGTGAEYVSDITEVNNYLSLAATDNRENSPQTKDIQFAQGDLETYLALSENAIRDGTVNVPLRVAGEAYAESGAGDLTTALGTLELSETNARASLLNAWARNPGWYWCVLLLPVICVLALAIRTADVLARCFRRRANRQLWWSAAVAGGTAIAVGVLIPEIPWLTDQHLALVGVLASVSAFAIVLAYRAYRDCLDDYRFGRS